VDRSRLAALLRSELAATSRPAIAAYLYGSEARGTARESSDIDIGILFESEPEPTLAGQPFELEARLETKLGRPVQVVALNCASADLIHRVLRDGVLLLETDRSARIRFEVRARNEYFDLEPLRRAYRRLGSEPG
jgi:predicted nucleotidyltransferase